jgi:glycosyltransferase involved in cell wall biosynthesis
LDNTVFRPLSRLIWNNAAAVVANSDDLLRLARTTSKFLPIGVIPNGVDCQEFRPNVVDDPDVLRLLFVGRFIERKGIAHLLRALPFLPRCKVALIGEGPLEGDLRSLSKSLSIEDRVDFCGYVPHSAISEYYQSADVFVSPSLSEGMSNSVLEAMASGLALVVSDTGGASDIVDHAGFVLPETSPGTVAEAVSRLVEDRNLLRRMKLASRRRALAYSWESAGVRYLELYRACISGCSSDGLTAVECAGQTAGTTSD